MADLNIPPEFMERLNTQDLQAIRQMQKDHKKSFSVTKLSKQDEAAFQSFVTQSEFFKSFSDDFGEPPNLDDPGYDYRGAFQELGEDMFALDPESGKQHGFSRTPSGRWLKSPDHPTAWKEYLMSIGKFP
jgi:hypothetical protein